MMDIDPKDLRIDTYGHNVGGMNVGLSRGVRIIHLPSGIMAECDSERGQFKNRIAAMNELEEKLKDWKPEKKELKFCDYEAFRMAGEQVDKAMQDFRKLFGVEPPAPPHPDDIAVDKFAAMMKEKLKKSREKGRNGWDDQNQCSTAFLAQLLVGHTMKGDPVDVANLAMMLVLRGASNEVLEQAMKNALSREYWRGRDDASRL